MNKTDLTMYTKLYRNLIQKTIKTINNLYCTKYKNYKTCRTMNAYK